MRSGFAAGPDFNRPQNLFEYQVGHVLNLPSKSGRLKTCPTRSRSFLMIRNVLIAALLALTFSRSASADEPKPAAGGAGQGGWESLYDGKSLEGWKITEFGGEG